MRGCGISETPMAGAAAPGRIHIVFINLQIRHILPPGMPKKNIMHRGLIFWKYRLEFLSRKKTAWLKHDPMMVLAGIAGACEGIVRFIIKRKKRSLK